MMIGMKLRSYTKTTGAQIFSFGCAVPASLHSLGPHGILQNSKIRIFGNHQKSQIFFAVHAKSLQIRILLAIGICASVKRAAQLRMEFSKVQNLET